MKIGTLTTGVGVTTTFQLPYVPESIRYIAATQLTSIKVNVLGVGVILDLDANGLTSCGNLRKIESVTNGYEFQLADGLIPNKNCEITIVNSAAQTPDIYVDSKSKGGYGYVRHLRNTAFANTPLEIRKFSYLSLQNGAAADLIDVTYQDGTVSKKEYAELPFDLNPYQSDVNTVKAIDNGDGIISTVRIIAAAQQSVYVIDVMPTDAGELLVSQMG